MTSFRKFGMRRCVLRCEYICEKAFSFFEPKHTNSVSLSEFAFLKFLYLQKEKKAKILFYVRICELRSADFSDRKLKTEKENKVFLLHQVFLRKLQNL